MYVSAVEITKAPLCIQFYGSMRNKNSVLTITPLMECKFRADTALMLYRDLYEWSH